MFSSPSSCSRNLLLQIENNQFRVLYPVSFYVFSREKIRVTTLIILNMDDTLDEDDVSMIFDELGVQKSPL